MIYVGTPENSPYTIMEAPNERILRCLLSPELDTTQKEIAAGLVEIKPGSKSDWRAHDEGELFFCISGCGHIRVGDEIIELYPDTVLWVPGGVPHQTFNDSENEYMKLFWVLHAPFGGDKAIISRWKAEHKKQKSEQRQE